MDYAIVKTGSKQYRVKPGDVIDVEKLPAEEGSSMELNEVLAVSRDGEIVVGDPLVRDASVIAEVRGHDRDKKIIVFKYKRKVRYRRKKGHRQAYTRLAITSIWLDGEEIAYLGQPTVEVLVPEEPPADDITGELEAEGEENMVGVAEELEVEATKDESSAQDEHLILEGASDELDDESIGDESIIRPSAGTSDEPDEGKIEGSVDQVIDEAQDTGEPEEPAAEEPTEEKDNGP